MSHKIVQVNFVGIDTTYVYRVCHIVTFSVLPSARWVVYADPESITRLFFWELGKVVSCRYVGIHLSHRSATCTSVDFLDLSSEYHQVWHWRYQFFWWELVFVVQKTILVVIVDVTNGLPSNLRVFALEIVLIANYIIQDYVCPFKTSGISLIASHS